MRGTSLSSQAHSGLPNTTTISSAEVLRGPSKQRKHVTTACLRCRQAKAKCDGSQPCARCAPRDLPCIYCPNEDDRSRASTKRRFTELRNDSEFLHDLLRHIRDFEDVRLAQVVSLIRSNASLGEINQCLVQLTNLAKPGQRQLSPDRQELQTRIGAAISQNISRTEDSCTTQDERPSSSFRNILSVQRLMDNPRYHVRATPWTEVATDDYLVSHLVSLWATWDNVFPSGIVFEFFLRDLRSQNIDSPFCSPFLVNCILAAACLYSDYNEARAHQGKSSILMGQFVKEAEKHLEEDNFKTTITNVQGLSVLFLLFVKMNQDRRGFGYATQATTLCDELMRNRDKLVSLTEMVEKKEVSYVVDYTCWGVFGSTTGGMLWWQRPQSLPEPTHPYPHATQVHEPLFQQAWAPYPREGGEQEMLLDEVQHQYAKLSVLERELTVVLYGTPKAGEKKNVQVKQEALRDLDTRFTRWLGRLPDNFKHPSPWIPPSVFVLRIWSQDVFITILMAQIQHCVREDHLQDGLSEGIISPISIELECDTIRERLLKQALEVVDFLRCYRSSFPQDVSRLNCVVSRPLHQSLSILLDANSWSKEHQHQYDTHITDICITLRAISRRVPFVVSILRAIQLDIRQRGLTLPQATEKVFEDFEQCDIKAWKEDASYTRAMYSFSNIAPMVGQQVGKDQNVTLGEFLQEFEDLSKQAHQSRTESHVITISDKIMKLP